MPVSSKEQLKEVRSTNVSHGQVREFVAPGHPKATFGGVHRKSDHQLTRTTSSGNSLTSADVSISRSLGTKDTKGTKQPVDADFKDSHEVDIEVPMEECNILMPLDGSDRSLYILYYYLKNLHREENSVYVVYVSDDFSRQSEHGFGGGGQVVSGSEDAPWEADQPPREKPCCAWKKRGPGRVDVGPSPGVLAALRRNDHRDCARTKHRVKHLFNKNGVRWSFRRLRGKDIAHTILTYGQQIDARFIVMGSRGQTGLAKAVNGSTSDKILSYARVPVMIIRKPADFKSRRISVADMTTREKA